jgi:exopolysaccharide biosynthesis WecB/TagA/CpsF family protein
MKHATFNTYTANQRRPLKTKFLPALGLSLVDMTSQDTVNALLAAGRSKAFFMNAHCCNVLRKDNGYKTAVDCADYLLPDGVGISLAAKMSGYKLAANLNGTDLIPELLKEAAKLGKSVYFFGGKPGVAETAASKLISKIPNLRIVGTSDGYNAEKNTCEVIADINSSGADILLVALGVPMQENWLHRNFHGLNTELNLGVGAAFDFFAGEVARAPKWVKQARSEWMWRLAMEPRRMAKRYLLGNITFLANAAKIAVRQVSRTTVLRRTLDVTVSAAALVLLAPVFVGTAIAVKAESRGPVLFKQTRVGKDGVPFEMIKFRSMAQNAEDMRAEVLGMSDREGVCFKSRNDPRITRVGRFIRRASIDELPQILNVLKGEMSIVGPRPALPSEVQAYPKRAYGRLAVKPGITGIWQVSGRADVGFDQMIDMDLAYARSRTVLVDLIVIALTFRAVISGRGAH